MYPALVPVTQWCGMVMAREFRYQHQPFLLYEAGGFVFLPAVLQNISKGVLSKMASAKTVRLLCVVLLLCVFPFSASATITIYKTITLPYVEMEYIFNEGNYINYAYLAWYYKGMSQMLNDYVELKVRKGELEDKKVNITIWLVPPDKCEECPVEVSRDENGYYIRTLQREYPLEYFVRIVDYFASSDWESFVCSEPFD